MPKVKFLLDADMPRSTADVLRSLGFKVDDVRDINLGNAKDTKIIEHALENNQIIITGDTDFGEVLRYPNHPGAIILRLPHTFRAAEINKRIKKFFNRIKPDDIIGSIIIVELDNYRKRPIE